MDWKKQRQVTSMIPLTCRQHGARLNGTRGYELLQQARTTDSLRGRSMSQAAQQDVAGKSVSVTQPLWPQTTDR